MKTRSTLDEKYTEHMNGRLSIRNNVRICLKIFTALEKESMKEFITAELPPSNDKENLGANIMAEC